MNQSNDQLGGLGSIGNTLRGALGGIRFGPGVLGAIIPIVGVGLVAIAVVTWTLSTQPTLAVGLDVTILLFLVYVLERAFRYAQANPLTALMGSTELYHLIKDQTAAKHPEIVVEAPPILGRGQRRRLIDNQGSDDV